MMQNLPWIISLYDESGNALRPWARAGFPCMAMDILNEDTMESVEGDGFIIYRHADLGPKAGAAVACAMIGRAIGSRRVGLVMSWSPCTDLAGCGAKHFAKKAETNPAFQDEAAGMARHVEMVAGVLGDVPWMAENPIGRLSTLWRKPDYYFNPFEFGGYLPVDDLHPRFPDIIPPRDAYPKKTCIWSSDSFVMPKGRPVEPIKNYPGWEKLGGKSARTKKIRSEGPRGFLEAVFQANVEAVREAGE